MKQFSQILKFIKKITKSAKKNNQGILIITTVIAAFFVGRLSYTIQEKFLGQKTNSLKIAQQEGKTIKEFLTAPSQQPELKFFVMSFCPYGNQAEFGLKPVFELLKDKIKWQPQYIVSKINIDEVCANQVYDRNRCQEYIDQGYFPNQESCRQRFYPDTKTCITEIQKQALMIDAKNGFLSLHGRNELNQDVREICAWNMDADKEKWWEFVDKINKNCNVNNVETCWEDQAKEVGYETEKIKECLNQQAPELLEKEVEVANKYQANSSPMIFINETPYPPEGAYGENTVLKISNNVFKVQDYRLPETFKEAVCSSFVKKPKECKQKLVSDTQTTVPAGSCGS